MGLFDHGRAHGRYPPARASDGMSTRKPQGIMSLTVLMSSSVPKSSEPRVETQNVAIIRIARTPATG